MPYSMNNSMWVLVHLSPVSACLIPTTNSMWVHCVFSLSHYVSQTLDPQEVSGTWLCFCQAVSWHLIPWTGGKWLKISALSGSLMSHVLFNDKQEVSDTFLVSGSLIMSHPMTNRMWVTPYFSISTCLTHPMTNSWWVILHFDLLPCSLIMSDPIIQWTTACEYHTEFVSHHAVSCLVPLPPIAGKLWYIFSTCSLNISLTTGGEWHYSSFFAKWSC